MSNFSKEDLDNLQKLCRIRCKPQEEQKLFESISSILEYVEQLNEIDTENVAPCTFVLKDMQKNVLREDVVDDHLDVHLFLDNAPAQIGGMIKIPPVIKP
jgi:aspartyl-tRNA(Asn)/glutamyl-tRNA(Gln) amidotransferase subunit C